MTRLLSMEWFKLRHYRAFVVLALLYGLLSFMLNEGIRRSAVQAGSGPVNILSSSYGFPAVWGNLGFVQSWFALFLCFLVIMSVCNEFSYRTLRQQVLDGMNRLDVLHAKVFLVLALSLSATLFYLFAGLLFGLLSGSSFTSSGLEKTMYVFIYHLNYLGFSALLAFLLRRTGLSIVVLFAVLIAESTLSGLLNWKLPFPMGNLLPLQCSDELLPLPVMKTLGNLGPAKAEFSPVVYAIVSLVYVGVYYGVLRVKIQRQDL